ncbi:MAG: pyruvate ferredoxin oxidoreductase subunit gamma [Chloroflexi bacterium]|nr:pyruvate ferredoxin oxidoreductase subunit gamma [Chloroflexota bacterium]
MKEILIYGRGGQGNVAAAEILATAAFEDGQFVQAFPAFGAERMGAPVRAFVRIHDQKIRTRSQVTNPDILIIQDETLLGNAKVMGSVKKEGVIIANSAKKAAELGLRDSATLWTVPARQIALEAIGTPIVNVVMLGAFCAVTGLVSLEAVKRCAMARFAGAVGEKNAQAAQQAYDWIKKERE